MWRCETRRREEEWRERTEGEVNGKMDGEGGEKGVVKGARRENKKTEERVKGKKGRGGGGKERNGGEERKKWK